MIYQLVVPGQVEDVEEMRVLEWHGEVGRVFAEGELIVEPKLAKVCDLSIQFEVEAERIRFGALFINQDADALPVDPRVEAEVGSKLVFMMRGIF